MRENVRKNFAHKKATPKKNLLKTPVSRRRECGTPFRLTLGKNRNRDTMRIEHRDDNRHRKKKYSEFIFVGFLFQRQDDKIFLSFCATTKKFAGSYRAVIAAVRANHEKVKRNDYRGARFLRKTFLRTYQHIREQNWRVHEMQWRNIDKCEAAAAATFIRLINECDDFRPICIRLIWSRRANRRSCRLALSPKNQLEIQMPAKPNLFFFVGCRRIRRDE